MKMTRKSLFATALVSVAMLGAAATALATQPATQPAAMPKDIVDTAVAAGSFKTLAKLLGDAGLVATLKGKGPFTVFAPTDEAFAKVSKTTLAALARDKNKLKAVLTYHVVAGNVMAKDVVSLKSAKTVQGQTVAISVMGSTVKINNATVTQADVVASNGVIHVIDRVLMPK